MTARDSAKALIRDARLANLSNADGVFAKWHSIVVTVGLHYYPGKAISRPLAAWFNDASSARISSFAPSPQTPLFELLTELGRLFEIERLELNSRVRKDQGAYFTPTSIANDLIEKTLSSTLSQGIALRDLTLCDPAAGTGAFVLPAFLKLKQLHREEEPNRSTYSISRRSVLSIFAVDIDPLTVAVLRSFLWILSGAHASLFDCISRQIRCGDALSGSTEGNTALTADGIRWIEDFASVMDRAGFSAVVGNPPWGTLRPMVSRAFGSDSSTSDRAASARKDYASQIRGSQYYMYQGNGDADLYRFFLERCTQLVEARGAIGLLVPAAFLRTEGAGPLRRYMLEQGAFSGLIERINTDRAFDIHSMFRYVELIWQRGVAARKHEVSFGNPGASRLSTTPVLMSSDYLRKVSSYDSGFPDVRTRAERDLLLRLTRSHPALTEPATEPWNVRFRREIDVTRAAQRFVHSSGRVLDHSQLDELGLLPLYEGRMVHQHDSYAKRYQSGSGRSADWTILSPDRKELAPQFYVPKQQSKRTFEQARAGFCDISGHANERTVLASIIPGGAIAGNKVPTATFDSGHPDLPFIWTAVANSFVIDWLMRRRVSTTINLFYWNQIPFPRIDPASPAGHELARCARALNNWNQSDPSEQLIDRSYLRARIDALVAESFGLKWSDLALILEDFPLIDREQVGSPTRDLLEEALSTSSDLARPAVFNLASIGYVPAEVSRALKLRGRIRGFRAS